MAHNVDILGRVGIVLVNAHAQEVDIALIHILEEQIERHSIVDVVAHIGLEDNRLRLCNRLRRSHKAERAERKEKEKSFHSGYVLRLQSLKFEAIILTKRTLQLRSAEEAVGLDAQFESGSDVGLIIVDKD